MSALRDLQIDFAQALLASDAASCDAFLSRCIGPHAVQGLAAYRASVLSNLAAAVVVTYPVVGAIVGDEFLAAAARAYATQVPSRSGDLNAYGDSFGEFLADFPPARALPYLPDVARLEWQCQQVMLAPTAGPVDLSLLGSVSPDDWGRLCFPLDPAHAIVSSRWPLARLWEINQAVLQGQAEIDYAIDFNAAQSVLVQRESGELSVRQIEPAEGAFLGVLGAGGTLAGAVDEAAAIAPDFDLGEVLKRHIASGLIRCAHR